MANQGGNLKSTSVNGVKVYTVASQQRSLATWLSTKKLRALRKDQNYMSRVDLIQDLRFETATSKIKATPDGEFLIASGIYPPQVKVYELRELALKFERHLDSEIVDFEILADDYSKLAFLCADRSIYLHAKYGKHHTMRIPRVFLFQAIAHCRRNDYCQMIEIAHSCARNVFIAVNKDSTIRRMGRDMAYDTWSCDLLCAASSPDLYRINLEQGRFLNSLNTNSPALNVVTRSQFHGLVGCGGEDGAVECFDTRTRSSIGRIDAVASGGDKDQGVTALEFEKDGGFLMAVGSDGGKVMIFDLRSSYPIRVKDHMYGSAILDIKWHRTINSEHSHLITTDSHIVRIWDPETGKGMTSIEPTGGKINDICTFKDSGLMLLALDSSSIPSYFIPALGPAPKWCSYLENLTEELEEGGQTTIYDDYKFVTKEDLEKLKLSEKFNLTTLIGTNYLRAYMHGYFIDHRLYKKAKALAEPFAYSAYIEQKKQEKLEQERANRITIKRKLPKVNRRLASQIIENEAAETEKDANADENKKTSKKKKGLGTEIFKDERFSNLFSKKEFEIDEFSQDYLALHPMASKKQQPNLLEEHFEPVEEDENERSTDSDAPEELSSEEEPDSSNHDRKKKARVPRLYEVKDARHADAFWNRVSLAKDDSLSMGERVAALGDDKHTSTSRKDVKLGPGGSREISFITKSSATYKEYEDGTEAPRKGRRGIQPLGLKPDRSEFRGQKRGGFRGRGRGRGRGSGGGGRRGRR